ncbi:hypothetical protein EJ110_NYTH16499 [Nymphaea thermarum]|nr:hypothetical protein EJ110_NYTH16499 [Nymphaea thermarum]
MEADASGDGYEPPPEFKQTNEDPLFGISETDSTELWLIQLPPNQFKPADFDGKEVKLKLRQDGRLGSMKNAAGKSFDIVSNGLHQSNATVFLAGSSSTRAVGKISRRVSLVSFEADAKSHGKTRAGGSSLLNWSSGGSSNRLGSHGNTSLTSSIQRSSQGISGTSFEGGEASQLPKQRRVDRSPSSEHSKLTMKGSPSPGSLTASQRSQGMSEASFEGGEPSESSKHRHVGRSPSSQDSKRSRDSGKSGTSDIKSASESVSRRSTRRKMKLEE